MLRLLQPYVNSSQQPPSLAQSSTFSGDIVSSRLYAFNLRDRFPSPAA
jgi:hypothetical protein